MWTEGGRLLVNTVRAVGVTELCIDGVYLQTVLSLEPFAKLCALCALVQARRRVLEEHVGEDLRARQTQYTVPARHKDISFCVRSATLWQHTTS